MKITRLGDCEDCVYIRGDNMNCLVSIVVPIYNVEKYLDRCIESLIGQTYRNIEIILIDDGSPDACPQICDSYAKMDGRIKVIHKENAGLGMARNTGIENATGEYICFFDSDDYVEPDTIEKCVSAALDNDADLVIFGHDRVTGEGKCIYEIRPKTSQKVFFGVEITERLLPMSLSADIESGEDWNLPLSAWNKMYSLKLIRASGWRFVSEREIISEDFYSLVEFHGYLRKVVILEDVFYHYTVNDSSLSRSYRSDRCNKVKEFYDAICILSDRMRLNAVLEQPINIITFGFFIGIMKQCVGLDSSFFARYRELNAIVRNEFLQDLVVKTYYPAVNFRKKLLYWAVRKKFTLACFAFVALRNQKDI